MLTSEERTAIMRADKYELAGPLTAEDRRYEKCANQQVGILRRRHIIIDEYSSEFVAKQGSLRAEMDKKEGTFHES